MSGPNDPKKQTGAYYTPPELVDCCLDSALDPILDEFAALPAPPEDPAGAILNPDRPLHLVDPSCGAGAFLVRAARRIGLRAAQLRSGTDDPPESVYRRALWEAVQNCIFGVDINPYAVELTKVVLWMDSAYEGSYCQFLEPSILCGNALLGTTPKLMEQGIPDAAWEAMTGDDKAVARELKARNRKERLAWEAAQKGGRDGS